MPTKQEIIDKARLEMLEVEKIMETLICNVMEENGWHKEELLKRFDNEFGDDKDGE